VRGAVRGKERAGELCLGRADSGRALGVAAREELVVRRGTMRAHGVGGDGHRAVRGCGHCECVVEGLVVSGLGRGGRVGEDARRGWRGVWGLGFCL